MSLMAVREKRDIYIYAVELRAGPRFGVSSAKNWPKFFFVFPIFTVFWGYF